MVETKTLDEFIKQQLKDGHYNSYEEMVETALRLLQEQDEELNELTEEMRPAVQRFLRGEGGVEFDADDIIQRGLQHLKSNSAK